MEGSHTLVLSRLIGESIVLAENIIVTVTRIQGPEKVRIGIEAPAHIKVRRSELLTADEWAEVLKAAKGELIQEPQVADEPK